MQERTVVWLCLAGSVSGIIALFFLSLMIVPQEMSPGEITRDHVGMLLKLNGTAEQVRTHPSGHIFFELRDGSGGVDVVIWGDRAEQLSFSGINVYGIRDGSELELTGTAELYRGSVQVVV